MNLEKTPHSSPKRASYGASFLSSLGKNVHCVDFLLAFSTFSALLSLCEGNPLVTGGFPSQWPVTWNFDIFFNVRLNKRLSKQSRLRWFDTPWCLLWRHCNVFSTSLAHVNWQGVTCCGVRFDNWKLHPSSWTSQKTIFRRFLFCLNVNIYIYLHVS